MVEFRENLMKSLLVPPVTTNNIYYNYDNFNWYRWVNSTHVKKYVLLLVSPFLVPKILIFYTRAVLEKVVKMLEKQCNFLENSGKC